MNFKGQTALSGRAGRLGGITVKVVKHTSSFLLIATIVWLGSDLIAAARVDGANVKSGFDQNATSTRRST
jgi:hypothetical protein